MCELSVYSMSFEYHLSTYRHGHPVRAWSGGQRDARRVWRGPPRSGTRDVGHERARGAHGAARSRNDGRRGRRVGSVAPRRPHEGPGRGGPSVSGARRP